MLTKPTVQTTWLPLGLAVVALAVLNLGLYTRLAPQQAAPPLAFPYYADYADPNTISAYVPFGGDWEVRDEMLVQLSTSGYDLGTVIPLQIPTDQPYIYEMSVRYLDGEHSGGILFNAQQPGTRQRSHMARFNTDGNLWWLIYGYFDDGSAFIGQGSVQLTVPARDPVPHLLGVRVSGSTYTLLVDGQPVAPDIPLQYQGGAVGLITAAAQVAFDDLRVEAYDPAQAVTPAPVQATEAPAPDVTVEPAVNETTLYGTEFDQDGAQSQWTTISGVWQFEAGALVQTQPEGFDLSTGLNVPFTAPYTVRASLVHRQGTGGGVLVNLPAATSQNGGTMVRYFEDGTVVAWGYFDASGVFNGQGSAPAAAPGSQAHALEVNVGRDTYTVRLDGAVLGENIPLNAPNATSYIGLTASQSVTAFESVTVSELAAPEAEANAAEFASGIDSALATGDWRVDGATVTQNALELTDYFAGTGVAAETFALSVDIVLPADNPQAGGGLVFHMNGRDDLRGGAMVRFGSGGSEIFWGEYNAEGVFAGLGGAPVTLTPGVPAVLSIIVRSTTYDVRVNGALVGENIPITGNQGWIGLISFSGVVTFSNMQLTLGES